MLFHCAGEMLGREENDTEDEKLRTESFGDFLGLMGIHV